MSQADPLIGQLLLGRYTPRRELGRGGMGRVYLAEQRIGKTVRQVALKTLHPELAANEALVKRFYREVETVAKLPHPNTVQIIDFGELDDGRLLLVMEFVEGEDLGDVLEAGPLPLVRIDRILLQVAGSLHEAHAAGVIHRDLKPENVMLTTRAGQRDFVKVLDFGIAKQLDPTGDASSSLTGVGTLLGTPEYMSPEQFKGLPLTPASDIYSLGLLVYEMLTGRLPFEANTPYEWATHHMTAEPPSPREFVPGLALSEAREAALMQALAKQAEGRFEDVLSFVSSFSGVSTAADGLAQLPPVSASVASSHGSVDVGGKAPTMSTQSFENVLDAAGLPGSRRAKRLGWLLFVTMFVASAAAAFWSFRAWRGEGVLASDAPAEPRAAAAVAPPSAPSAVSDSTSDAASAAVPAPEVEAPPSKKRRQQSRRRARSAAGTKRETQAKPAESTPAQVVEPKPDAAATAKLIEAAKQRAQAAVNRGDVAGALAELHALEAKPEGRAYAKQVRGTLRKQGPSLISVLILQGRCKGARTLYKELDAMGGGAAARKRFIPGICSAPR